MTLAAGVPRRVVTELYDAHDPRELLSLELAQRAESGYDVSVVANRLASELVSSLRPEALFTLLDEIAYSERRSDWAYEEPEGLEAILLSLPTSRPVAGQDGHRQDVPDSI